MQADGSGTLGGVRVADEKMPFQAEKPRSKPAPPSGPTSLLDQSRVSTIGRDRDSGENLERFRSSCLDSDNPTAFNDRTSYPRGFKDLDPSFAGSTHKQVIERRSTQPNPRQTIRAGHVGHDLATTRRRDPDRVDRVKAGPSHVLGQSKAVEHAPALGAQELTTNLVAREPGGIE
jgi:hypothetical protein